MRKFFILFCFLLISSFNYAQKNSYRFAATYFGIEGEFSRQTNSFSYINKAGSLQQAKLPSTFSPRILIGATHFWNRADFYLSLNMGNLLLSGSKNAKISNDVLTGFRVIPFQLRKNRPRPFFGVGFHSKEYSQKGDNGQSQLYTNWQWFFESGISYTHKNRTLFGLAFRYFPKNNYSPYYNRTHAQSVEVSPYSLSVSYKLLFDFSASFASENSKRFFKKMEKELSEKKKLNTFSFGIGVSALIPLEKTEHASRKAFLNDEIEGNILPEVGLAYFHHRLNTSARVSYRPLQQKEEAYNYTYQLTKHSVALEAFKFIGNYHGFVPFVGPYISHDSYALTEVDRDEKITDLKNNKIGYGLVFGWDIRFTAVDHIILRTNLRYTPDFGYQQEGLNYTSKHLEFNFIQLVYYPQRHKVYKQLIRK